MDTSAMRKLVDERLLQRRHFIDSVKAHRRKRRQTQEKLDNLLEARQVIQNVAQAMQKVTHARIASVVSRCLQTILAEEAYDFQILFEKKRGKTEARPVLLRQGNELDPIEGAGLGVVDVVAFALRLAKIMLSRPRVRRLLVLDEPFRHLSKRYRAAARQLLLLLSEEMRVQIIMVTHSTDLLCGKVVEIG